MFETWVDQALEASIDQNPNLESIRADVVKYLNETVLDTINQYVVHNEDDIRDWFCQTVESEFPIAENDDCVIDLEQ